MFGQGAVDGEWRGSRCRLGTISAELIAWGTVLTAFLVAGIVLVPPFFLRTDGHGPADSCYYNLEQIGLAVDMYCRDYDGTLPSSILYGGSKTWNRNSFALFARTRGVLPPPVNSAVQSWPMVLYPYLKDKDAIWCPSDHDRSDSPEAVVSYYWKAAVDRAWYGDASIRCQKLSDFSHPGDQILLYERNAWHWSGKGKGLCDGATVSCLYLDGHVQTKRISNSTHPPGRALADPTRPGEPAWFNYSFGAAEPTFSTGENWNPKVWGDNLP